jgi:hypothetical protein
LFESIETKVNKREKAMMGACVYRVGMKVWAMVVLALALMAPGPALGRVFEVQTPVQEGVTITTTLDTQTHQLTYGFDLTGLPYDYEQIAFSPAPLPAFSGIPLEYGAVSSPGATEWNFHQIRDDNNQLIGWQLELQYQTGAPPPRDNSVLINYEPTLFLPGLFEGQPGDDNVEVTLRRPPEGFPDGVEDNVPLWAPRPIIAIVADFNLNGVVGVPDLIVWAKNFGATDASFTDGDADLDGHVGVPDLITWAKNFGQGAAPIQTATAPTLFQSSPATAIPEPNTAGMLAMLGGLGWALSQRRFISSRRSASKNRSL